MAIEVTVWECEYCGEQFDSKGCCKSHEDYCEDNPDNLLEVEFEEEDN
jgi:hypothetical protein